MRLRQRHPLTIFEEDLDKKIDQIKAEIREKGPEAAEAIEESLDALKVEPGEQAGRLPHEHRRPARGRDAGR